MSYTPAIRTVEVTEGEGDGEMTLSPLQLPGIGGEGGRRGLSRERDMEMGTGMGGDTGRDTGMEIRIEIQDPHPHPHPILGTIWGRGVQNLIGR